MRKQAILSIINSMYTNVKFCCIMVSSFLFDVGGEISELTTAVRKNGSLIRKAERHIPIQLHRGLSESML